MQNPPPVQTAKSSTGLDENIAALLSYIVGWVSGLIFFLIEKDSRLVRFHAMQSILLNIVVVVLLIASWVISMIFWLITTQLPGILAIIVNLIVGLVWIVVAIAILIAIVMCLVKAFQGVYFKLPVIGALAEKFSAK